MEQLKGEGLKLPDMVSCPLGFGGTGSHIPRVAGHFVRGKTMCGDHPSFTKTELNVKESKDKIAYGKISPSTSRTNAPAGGGGGGGCGGGGGGGERRSDHTIRVLEARRRVRSMETVARGELEVAPGNRALVQAALGSFRWPPYLLCVWVVVLILTHLLHCLVTVLERTLPNVKKFSQYFRQWTEEAWKEESDLNHRVYPLALAAVTGLLYALYYSLYVVYSVALWAIEPLAAEIDDKQSAMDVLETKVTDYAEEGGSKTNLKH